jgi:hypothetical protein
VLHTVEYEFPEIGICTTGRRSRHYSAGS